MSADSPFGAIDVRPSLRKRRSDIAAVVPSVPSEFDAIEWSRLTPYTCQSCNEFCLNQWDTRAAASRQCWYCLSLPSIEDYSTRLRSVFGLDPASRSAFHPIEEFGCVRRHAEAGPNIVLITARQLRQSRDADHRPKRSNQKDVDPGDLAGGTSVGTAERRAPPSGAAGSDPLRVDPEAGAQGPTEGTDPTTAKPQRRLSDSEARTDGGRRE